MVGAGGRVDAYHREAIAKHPEHVRIVMVTEPMAQRCHASAKQHDIPPDHCFESYQEIAAVPTVPGLFSKAP